MDYSGKFRGTTILMVRRGDKVAVAGDGQVTLGDTVMKHKAKKVRRLYHGKIVAGFAGSAADALTLFERLEAKLEAHQGNLTRAVVELAKDWRTDRILAAPGGHAAHRGRQRLLSHLRHRRRHRAGRRGDGHRLRRRLRPVCGAGFDGAYRVEPQRYLPGGHEYRGVVVCVYE